MKISIDSLPNTISEISSDEFNVEQINSIAKLYKKERQESKAPSFALT